MHGLAFQAAEEGQRTLSIQMSRLKALLKLIQVTHTSNELASLRGAGSCRQLLNVRITNVRIISFPFD
jgi:hypothetical protein